MNDIKIQALTELRWRYVRSVFVNLYFFTLQSV